jgi:hypothetical protein
LKAGKKNALTGAFFYVYSIEATRYASHVDIHSQRRNKLRYLTHLQSTIFAMWLIIKIVAARCLFDALPT